MDSWQQKNNAIILDSYREAEFLVAAQVSNLRRFETPGPYLPINSTQFRQNPAQHFR
jgi:hypothetical protein